MNFTQRLAAVYNELCELEEMAREDIVGYADVAELLMDARSTVSEAMNAASTDEDGYDDSMDGDHASALASAGWGTDEDYGDFGSNDDY